MYHILQPHWSLTVYQQPHPLASAPVHKKAQWLDGHTKSVCRCPLCTCCSLAMAEALCMVSMSLSLPHLCERDSCGIKPAHKEAGRLGSQGKERRHQRCKERRKGILQIKGNQTKKPEERSSYGGWGQAGFLQMIIFTYLKGSLRKSRPQLR